MLKVRKFAVPKRGNSEDEYEDACSFSAVSCRAAIADGATESSFAGQWAQTLVERFVSGEAEYSPGQVQHDLHYWLMPIQKAWTENIPWQSLPWYAEEKARLGAFAAFVGLQVTQKDQADSSSAGAAFPEDCVWSAVACGDSCLFHVRCGELLCAFPISNSIEFGNSPTLLSSVSAANERALTAVVREHGECCEGDLLLLATDALSCWILSEHEAGTPPWETINGLSGQEEFCTFVDNLRQRHEMKNDDVTLLIIELTGQWFPPEQPASS
jgi:hypothetical protein